MERRGTPFVSRLFGRLLLLSMVAVFLGGCVEGASGGTPVGESQYLTGPDGEFVYYRTSDGQGDFLEIDFTVASEAVVSGADASSFELVADSLAWARDNSNVFFAGQLVPTADPLTIEVLTVDGVETGWARDAEQVYRRGEPVLGADPTTFALFEENTRWGRDRNTVFFGQTAIDGSDPATFELLNGATDGWARDAERVYRDGDRVDGLDSATFELLDAGYYLDANSLYYEGEVVEGANTSAVQARASSHDDHSNLAWDDSQIWFNGEPVTVRRNDGSTGTMDVDSLAASNTDFVLADADGVYARLIEHADRPAHFYQIDLVNAAAYEGGATESDDVLRFTVEPAGVRSLGAPDARERIDSLLRFGVFEIAPEADVERLGCAYWRRDERIFYYGVLVEGQAASGFSPQDQSGACRTETWLLDAILEFQE